MKILIVLLLLTSSAFALEPVVKSGTRLQVRSDTTSYAGSDGSSVKNRGQYYLYDTMIGHKCEIVSDTAGTRCDPTSDMNSGIYIIYSDSACTHLFLNPAPGTVISPVRYLGVTDAKTATYAMYQLGAMKTVSPIYEYLAGRCRLSPAGSAGYYELTLATPGPALTIVNSVDIVTP